MILIACFMIGLALGVLFYGGLWLTVRRLLTSHHPVVLTLGSLLLRSGAALAGFWMVTDGDWRNTAACLVGFVVARIVVSRELPVCT
jgi:F1F0 ATPase subunit 2